MLLDAGADVGASDINGNTSLHWAVLNNFTDIIDTLLYSGAGIYLFGISINLADVNAVSNNGNTPLLLAVSARQLEICDKLIQWGAGSLFYIKEIP